MSMLDTLGGAAGGLGGSGGVGGSIPSNSSAANSAATATISPTTTLGTIGGGYNAYGPFAVNFPGVGLGSSGDINAAPVTQRIFTPQTILMVALGGLLVILFLFKR